MRAWVSGFTEETIGGHLEKRGWPVLETQRRGADLHITTLTSEPNCQPARILCLNPFTPGRDVDAPAGDPIFLRIQLGQPDELLTAWAVWQEIQWAPDTGRRLGITLQAAVGSSWLQMAASYAPDLATIAGVEVADALFVNFDRLVDELYKKSKGHGVFELDPERSLGEWPCLSGPRLIGSAWQRLAPSAAMVGLSGLGAIAIWTTTGDAFTALGCLSLASASALAFGMRTGGALHHRLEWRILAELRSSTAFESTHPLRYGKPLAIPVVLSETTGREQGYAMGRNVLFGASSSHHSLELRLRLWSVDWPVPTVPDCRLVPGCWAIIELLGSEHELSYVPDWPRQVRTKYSVRWLLTGDEMTGGALTDLLTGLSRKLAGSRGGPYR